MKKPYKYFNKRKWRIKRNEEKRQQEKTVAQKSGQSVLEKQ